MAYNSYFPTFYGQNNPYSMMPQNQPQIPQNAQQGSGTGIIWVQGESAAKSYPVAAGQSVLLMDSENAVMYIKSVDQSGMPLPLRVFDYSERKAEKTEVPTATSDYISRSEFEEFKEDVKRSIKGIRRPVIDEEGEG